MKQCGHCGWETSNPKKISVHIRDDFEIRIYLCPECYEAYLNGLTNDDKSPVW
jgi:hypothetical protein